MSEITQHHQSAGELQPGYLPAADVEHRLRVTDTSPSARRRAERQVAALFGLSMLSTIGFVIAYVGVDKTTTVYVPVLGNVGASNLLLGLTMGLAVFCIGAGAIQWSKKLMSDVEYVQERHELVSDDAATAEAAGNYERGKESSGFAQFRMVRRTLIGALALFPIPLVVMLRDLWITPAGSPSPDELLHSTVWDEGMRIVTDPTGLPIKPEDLPIGGLVSAIPAVLAHGESHEGEAELTHGQNLIERGKAAVILVRMDPAEIRSQQGDGWDYQGILAYSKICTHLGCPIALYEQRTHHLLCPCHQSTFDLADSGNVVFGPAARRMPQLPITLDAEGYLVAKSDFAEAVGPSWWGVQ